MTGLVVPLAFPLKEMLRSSIYSSRYNTPAKATTDTLAPSLNKNDAILGLSSLDGAIHFSEYFDNSKSI